MDDRSEHPHPQELPEALPLAASSTVVRTRRPTALWAVLAAVAVTVGAVAINAGGDDARPALPVSLGGGGFAESAAADSSMLAWVSYVAGDGLPALGGEAAAYRLDGAVTEADVRDLASALGLDAPVQRSGVGWSVVDDQGTLEVTEALGGQWHHYSSAGTGDAGVSQGGGSSGSVGCDPVGEDVSCTATTFVTTDDVVEGTTGGDDVDECAANDGPAECITGECPPDGPCAVEDDPGCTPEECGLVDPVPLPEPRPSVPPAPPVDLPSEGDARQTALDLLARTGLAVDGAIVTVDGPYDAWYVTVEPRVDGLASGLLASVSVGPDGAILSANGFLATPERLGDYPILDTRGAIDRANAGFDALRSGSGPDTGTLEVDDRSGGEVEVGGDESTSASDTTTGGDIACEALTPECGYPGVHTCEIRPDGQEICEVTPCPPVTTIPGQKPSPELCPPSDGTGIVCLQVPPSTGGATDGAGSDGSTDAGDTTTGSADAPVSAPACTPPVDPPLDPAPEPPLPEPGPLEVVLVDAELALQLLGADDGSPDAYLVPAYRFTAEDGGTVDLPAVADEALAGSATPEPSTTDPVPPDTAVPPPPDTTEPAPVDPCKVLVEDDGSGTTHTVQPAPGCDPQGVVELGVPYDVQVISHCGHIADHDGRWWSTVEVVTDLGPDSGVLTLETRDLGIFEGGGLTTEFEARGPADEYPGCD